jgi:fatty-acid desaturase
MATVAATPQKTDTPELAVVQAESSDFNWVFFVVIAGFHLGAIAAPFFFRWSSVAIFLVMWVLGQNVGIAISYHRQLTHRSFTTPKWLEYAMAICGTMALQGSPTYWVAVHRMHHQYTDKPGDPHSPRDGKWWSHVGWILTGSIHSETTRLSHYAPDLERDRFYRWLAVAQCRYGFWRMETGCLVAALGRVFEDYYRLPHNVAGQFGNPSVGIAPLQDA